MVKMEERVSIGRTVRDIAVHYYMGLTGKDEEYAKELFKNAVASDDNRVASALRMAEHEILHG